MSVCQLFSCLRPSWMSLLLLIVAVIKPIADQFFVAVNSPQFGISPCSHGKRLEAFKVAFMVFLSP